MMSETRRSKQISINLIAIGGLLLGLGGVANADPILASTHADTVQVEVIRWNSIAPAKGENPVLTKTVKEHVAIDQKNDKIRLETELLPTSPSTLSPGLLVHNGKKQVEYIVDKKLYINDDKPLPIDGGFKSELSLFSDAISRTVGTSPLTGVKLDAAADETIDGKTVHVYSAKNSLKNDRVDLSFIRKLYVDPDTNLAVRFSFFIIEKDGSLREYSRDEFSDWKIGKPIDSSLFAWTPPADAKPYVAPKRQEMIAVGSHAPEVTAQLPTGDTVKLSDYKGKIVILDFWATWCGPCQKSMPHLQHVYDQVKDANVAVLAVCVVDTKDKFSQWVEQNKQNYGFPVAFEPKNDAQQSESLLKYKVQGIPATFVIDKNGDIAAAISGYMTGDQRLEAALAKLGAPVKTEKAALIPANEK